MMKQRQKHDSSMKPENHGIRGLTYAGRRESGPIYAGGLVPLLGASA
jgi:hypothetical protein